MTKDHKRGAVLTSQEAALIAPITDTGYLIMILYYKRLFGAVITDVIPPAAASVPALASAPSKPPITQIGIFEEKAS